MALYLKLARFYLVLLAIVTAGRWFMSFRVPFEVGTDKMSIVILTLFASIFYAAFCRRWKNFSLMQAVALAATLAVCSQLVILLSTAVSYLGGLETYFNHPKALNIPAGQPLPDLPGAIVIRLQGLIGNTIGSAIAGVLGWSLGAALPKD